MRHFSAPRRVLQLRKALSEATKYDDWKSLAYELDEYQYLLKVRATGKEKWKSNPKSHYYDYKLIQTRTDHIKTLSESGDISSTMFLLRAGLIRNLGGLTNPKLFTPCNSGTKMAIQLYVDEVINTLYMIAKHEDDEEVSTKVKLEYFADLSQSFGKTALLFTGGGSFGMMHLGVAKALVESRLMPRIICGSSIGSLIASLIGVCTDDKIVDLLDTEDLDLNLDAFEKRGEGGIRRKILRFLKHGILRFEDRLFNGHPCLGNFCPR